jgi:hypothetical protein
MYLIEHLLILEQFSNISSKLTRNLRTGQNNVENIISTMETKLSAGQQEMNNHIQDKK